MFWGSVLLGMVLAVLAGWAIASYPAVAATACPSCYGLVELEESVFTERGLTDEQRRRVLGSVRAAEARIGTFFGRRQSSPRILACATDECYSRIGGGRERGVAVLNRAVLLSPRGITPTIATHEMTHVELHQRLDSADDLPQWFDEGLAVLVSEDPRYLRDDSESDRCRVEPEGDLPATLSAWSKAAGADPAIYGRAACKVGRWRDANGGDRAVLDLITRLNEGESFDTAWRRNGR